MHIFCNNLNHTHWKISRINQYCTNSETANLGLEPKRGRVLGAQLERVCHFDRRHLTDGVVVLSTGLRLSNLAARRAPEQPRIRDPE